MAKAAALKALELDPALGEAHVSLAQVLTGYDWDFPAAEREFKHAIELNPGYPTAHHFYAVYLMAMGRQEEAIAEERRTIELDSSFYPAHSFLGGILLRTAHEEEAVAEFRKALELSHGGFFPLVNLGYARGVMGNRAEAMKVLQRLSELSKQRYIPAYYFAMVHAGLGQRDQAFAWLEKAYQERSDFLLLLKVHETMASLRSDRRFADLVRRIGLPP